MDSTLLWLIKLMLFYCCERDNLLCVSSRVCKRIISLQFSSSQWCCQLFWVYFRLQKVWFYPKRMRGGVSAQTCTALQQNGKADFTLKKMNDLTHRLRTPREEIAFTARPKIHSHSQIFRYGRSIFCLPHQPKFSDFFDLCFHRVSVVRDCTEGRN